MTTLVAGTATGVGKNTITSGVLRLLNNSGISVAPFKAISVEHLPTEASREITPSIRVQAQAAGIDARVEMNPVRIVYPAEGGPPIYLQNGLVADDIDHHLNGMDRHIHKCLSELEESGEVIMEGSGALAEYYESPILYPLVDSRVRKIILVADAYNGGALASIVGTLELAPRHWLNRVRMVVINRFAGFPWEEPIPRWTDLIQQRYGVPHVLAMPVMRHLEALCEDTWPMLTEDRVEDDIQNVAETLRLRSVQSLREILDGTTIRTLPLLTS